MSKWFILEGDWGGQIYLTIPIAKTTAERAQQALRIIDAVEWSCNERRGASFYTQDGQPGDGVWGGMGGGLLTEGLWTHHHLNPALKLWVASFLIGEANLPNPETMADWLLAEELHCYCPREEAVQKMRRALHPRQP